MGEGVVTADYNLAPAYDAAQVQWGGGWRMPTYDDLQALCDSGNCDWTWVATNGVNGYIVSGKGDYASSSIFLPCAGNGDETRLSVSGSWGMFRSSVPHDGYNSHTLYLADNYNVADGGHIYGFSIRPVQNAPAPANQWTSGDCTVTLDTDTGTLTVSGDGAMEDYTFTGDIPWFSDRDDIKAIVLEDGVTSIGDSAFCGCCNLLSVTIPDTVTSIGSWAFGECDGLKSLAIPDSVTSIGDYAFAYCDGLVLAYPGTYAPITVADKDVEIRAVFGPDSDAPDAAPAVIDGGGVARCATLGEGVVLSGFILRNGRSDFGGGALGGTLANCVIENCSAVMDDEGFGGLGGGAYGSALSRCIVTNCAADVDGGGRADFATYLATAKVPVFRIRTQLGEESEILLGQKGATPFAVDIDDDGKADPGVFQGNAKKPSFTVLQSTLGWSTEAADAFTLVFGTKGAKAVVGDFDGDGRVDLGCYTATASKPVFKVALSGETWSDKAPLSITLGAKGAEPCCGDFDGDGITDFAAYSGTAKAPLLYRMFSTSKWREVRTLPFGEKGSRAAIADWDGDGAADAAIEFRGRWWYVTRGWDVAPILAP